jgi:XTP/dITP diphosphohydrolase
MLAAKPTLLLATTNPGKLRELNDLLAGWNVRPAAPDAVGLNLAVAETGATYAENALLKAHAYAAASGLPALADDSGLEVDALGGAPGLHSARFSPEPGATDADRRALLLVRLAGQPQPWTARFVCVVALVGLTDTPLLAEGVCPGVIAPRERGTGGFGYDPLFVVDGLGRTMAELSAAAKNRISHRARAIQALFDQLAATEAAANCSGGPPDSQVS